MEEHKPAKSDEDAPKDNAAADSCEESDKGKAESTAQPVPPTGQDELVRQIQCLREENRKMQAEFNAQRAKLKELFIQKETDYVKCQAERQALKNELDELKTQYVLADIALKNELTKRKLKAEEEISSLQQLVQDTIEESTDYKSQLEQMKEECSRLWVENRELREGQQQQESTSLGPQVLSQMKKTIVRKLGGDSTSSALGGSFYQESVDETSRNRSSSTQFAHEDADLLRSIVVQLQEEMKALKEKLRDADEKLQSNQETSGTVVKENIEDDETSTTQKSTSIDLQESSCQTCNDYELKVQDLLQKRTEDQEKLESVQKCLTHLRESLAKEAELRKDLEDQWQEKREAHKSEVQALRDQAKTSEKQLLDLQQKFLETKEEVIRQLQRLTDDRERVNKQLETLQADNEFLSGHYLATAEEFDSQDINLPNTVVELQELVLRQQNELIQARVSSEFEKQKCVTSLDEIQILRDQLDASNNERRSYKKKVQTDIKSLQDRLTEHLKTLQNNETAKAELERKETELNRQISEFRVEIIEHQEKIEKLNKMNNDYKAKIKNLQDDLVTSEQVQKDFVKLSQTLQMSLEKLRHADTEVRWQDDEDVDNCPSCNTYFTVTVRKIHCRHCGHIYCDKCLAKTVPSGPRKRNARVCDICHTLLSPNTAPYFSHEALQST